MNGVGSAVTNIWSKWLTSRRSGRTRHGRSMVVRAGVEGQHESCGVSKVKGKCKEEMDRDDSDLLSRLRTVWREGGVPFLETLLRRRLYDIAATTPLRVTFNKIRIDLPNIANVKRTKNLAAYAMLLGAQEVVHVDLGARWECDSAMRPPSLDLEPPSFVNGIRTDQGGEFVDVVTQPLFQKLVQARQGEEGVSPHEEGSPVPGVGDRVGADRPARVRVPDEEQVHEQEGQVRVPARLAEEGFGEGLQVGPPCHARNCGCQERCETSETDEHGKEEQGRRGQVRISTVVGDGEVEPVLAVHFARGTRPRP